MVLKCDYYFLLFFVLFFLITRGSSKGKTQIFRLGLHIVIFVVFCR